MNYQNHCAYTKYAKTSRVTLDVANQIIESMLDCFASRRYVVPRPNMMGSVHFQDRIDLFTICRIGHMRADRWICQHFYPNQWDDTDLDRIIKVAVEIHSTTNR